MEAVSRLILKFTISFVQPYRHIHVDQRELTSTTTSTMQKNANTYITNIPIISGATSLL